VTTNLKCWCRSGPKYYFFFVFGDLVGKRGPMKLKSFTSIFLFAATLLAAFLGQMSLVVAGEIPGYIGAQSFRLSDDPQLYDLSRRAEGAKVELARIDQVRAQIADQVNALSRERDQILGRMNDLQRAIESSKQTKAGLLAKFDELNKDPEANKDQIAEIKAQMSAEDSKGVELSKQLGANKLELGSINPRLLQSGRDLQIATENTQSARGRLEQIARDREQYRQDLIAALSMINREGANRGQGDGSNDGAGLSRKMGIDRGSRDGNTDGLDQGTMDGQDRYYKRGADQGERDGAGRARLEGNRDGTNEGTRAGNSNAGSREGRVAGLKRGDASDAASVGTGQGKKAGMERAVRTGAVEGKNKGESETVQKFEAGDLNALSISGPFAGSFQRRSPDYPGDFQGPSYNPTVWNSRDLMKRAYADGYIEQYRQYTRYEFLRRIDTDYNQTYDSSYASSYSQASNREYPDYYNRGRNEADARAYNRDYPIVKAQAYEVAFNAADINPSRSSDEFKSSYKATELSAFNERYEQIRKAYFDKNELELFKANIAEQTEIFRQKRISEVTKIYSNYAVLAFVNSEMVDGGINGVAKQDGVYQPGETTVHSLTLRNFGMKAAENVSVALDNGALVKLPSIPARSVVKITGAGLSKIADKASLGSTAKTSLKVISALKSGDSIEGAHFDDASNAELKSSDVKSASVAYPLALSSLSLQSQLLKGKGNKLSVTLANNSKRAYSGELVVSVLVNSQSPVLSKEFGAITSLQSTATLSDAEVLVTDERDVYRDLSFSAKVSQNGVTLGVLSADLVAMAKAPYMEKAGTPVLVANSEKNLDALLDALSTLGGIEKASVLDLSLAGLNSAVLANGLNQKVLLIADDEKGSNISTLNAFVAKSKLSAFVFIDEANAGLKNAQSLAASKDAQKLLWDKRQVVFTNPHRAEGVVKSSAMIQSSLDSFQQDLELAKDLTLSANDLISRFKGEINSKTFFTPNNAVKMYSLKAVAEILCINKAYNESGGIFTRNKKWAEMISDDATLFHNALKAAAAGEVTEAKLASVLPAIALKDALGNAIVNSYNISKVMMPKITNATNKVLGDLEDGFKKSLKNFNKDLYNKAYEQASIHRPFYIEPAQQPTN